VDFLFETFEGLADTFADLGQTACSENDQDNS
jgi:hypothetical protein